MLIEMDSSYHDWLEGRRPWHTLLLAEDDATWIVTWTLESFRGGEDVGRLDIRHTKNARGIRKISFSGLITIGYSLTEMKLWDYFLVAYSSFLYSPLSFMIYFLLWQQTKHLIV
jgi:hypothetical protein